MAGGAGNGGGRHTGGGDYGRLLVEGAANRLAAGIFGGGAGVGFPRYVPGALAGAAGGLFLRVRSGAGGGVGPPVRETGNPADGDDRHLRWFGPGTGTGRRGGSVSGGGPGGGGPPVRGGGSGAGRCGSARGQRNARSCAAARTSRNAAAVTSAPVTQRGRAEVGGGGGKNERCV